MSFEREKIYQSWIFQEIFKIPLQIILKLRVIPAGAFSIIQDSVQDVRQNVETPKIIW